MHVTSRSRLQLTLNNLLFTLLWLTLAAMLAWLSTRYHVNLDWTANGRNSLSESSQTLLQRMQEPVSVTAYARNDDLLRGSIRDLVSRYQRYKDNLTLEFVDPDSVPARVRELGIQVDGELVLNYQGRSQHVLRPTEKALSNGLQKVARQSERWLAFLEGHGERSLEGQANHDLSRWVQQLESRGVRSRTLNLAANPHIPDNTSALVIAGPGVQILPGEIQILRRWIRDGGNLLWLLDPGGDLQGLQPLLEQLGLATVAGVIVDPATQMFGIQEPDMAIIARYPDHPATLDFDLLTVFPHSMGLQLQPSELEFDTTALLTTEDHAWSETGPLEGEIQLDDEGDQAGPLTIGYALSRTVETDTTDPDAPQSPVTQRIVVIGDGDFLSNSFLGNAGNLDLGVSLVNWLVEDDDLLTIPVRTAMDQQLELSVSGEIIIAVGQLLVIPGLLLGAGLLIWWRRRKR